MLIPLTKGKFAIIDPEDLDRVSAHKWCAFKGRNTYYAGRGVKRDGKWTTTSLHRFLMDDPPGMQVDHINGDGLDCRRSNIRVSTHSQNQSNRKATVRTSAYRGVSWHARQKKWRAAISHDNKHIHIGHFSSEEEAARAYDAKAKSIKGEFAALNFP
jgi:hypothetical protein